MFRKTSLLLVTAVIATGSAPAGAKTEDRSAQLGAFDAIEVGGAFDVEISAKGKPSVVVSGDEDVLERILTRVVGRTLRISLRHGHHLKGGAQVKIAAPGLKRLELSGAVEAELTNLSAASFELEASGATDVDLQGKCTTLRLSASGASDIDARELTTDTVKIDMSGAGSAKVHAGKSLDAEASGASTIRYWGNPKEVKRDTSGVSHIERAD